MEEQNPRVFDIGVALAGGATRGTYIAGVMDFLLEALSEWQTAIDGGAAELPPWRVRLKTLAGTSAGGITAAITTAAICGQHKPLHKQHRLGEKVEHNNLYKLWVEETNAQNLFDCGDLIPTISKLGDKVQPKPVSIFNSKYMETQSATALECSNIRPEPPSWASHLEILFTTSNLRGIPYSFKCISADRSQSFFQMTKHRDWVGFTTQSKDHDALHSINLAADRNTEAWNKLRSVAQATATLPVLFPTKRLTISKSKYQDRVSGERPDWPDNMPDEYEYDAVDGALFLNEPMRLVRSSMEAGCKHDLLHRDATKTAGSMILVDPSPTATPFRPEYNEQDDGFLNVLKRMVSALMRDANFQESELSDISDSNNISRFLIAPVREGNDGSLPHLATDIMSGFGGVLDEEIRLHDFKLGRRNCQKFLRKHFVVPLHLAEKNSIFGAESLKFAEKVGRDSKTIIPIIPLCGSAKETCPQPQWPRLVGARRDQIEANVLESICGRVSMLLKSLAIDMGFYGSSAVSLVWNFFVDRLLAIVSKRIMAQVQMRIKEALESFS